MKGSGGEGGAKRNGLYLPNVLALLFQNVGRDDRTRVTWLGRKQRADKRGGDALYAYRDGTSASPGK